jgi:cathepsin D
LIKLDEGIVTPHHFNYLSFISSSGSSDLWLPSEKCQTCSTHKTFDSEASSTYSMVSTSSGNARAFRISYGSGDIAGNVATDTVTVSTLTLPNVIFGEVTSEGSTISSFDMDGIVGLAFDGLAVVTEPGIFSMIQSNYANLSQSFSLYLSSDPDDHTKPSKIMFGYYDLDIVSPDALFFYTPVVRYTSSLTYWTVAMTGFEIGTTATFTTAESVLSVFSLCQYGYVNLHFNHT